MMLDNPDACGYCGFDVRAEEVRDEALGLLRALIAARDHDPADSQWIAKQQAEEAWWADARRLVALYPQK
jgi:hypothetical protein